MRILAFAFLAATASAADLTTVEELTTIAERFQAVTKATGWDPPKPLPKIFIRSRPGVSEYDPKPNEITFPDWHALPEEARADFRKAGKGLAEPLSGERYFSETFRYFFVHELCHWVQTQEFRIDSASQIDDPYAFEHQANQCATAFWDAAEPTWMKTVAGRMTAVLAQRNGAQPWGADLRGWFNKRYPKINSEDYGPAQFRMAVDTWNASPRVAFAGVMEEIDREGTRRFWDNRYREATRNDIAAKSGRAEFRWNEASPLLVEAIRDRKAGAALDLGLGEGRNSLYMASEKWRVTGVDLSGVAVENARKAAAARGLALDLKESDLDAYDLGEAKWDLITSFYMQDWHYRSKTGTFARIAKAMRPGGLFVLEGFGPPRLRQEAIEKAFAGWRILRSETVEAVPEWGRDRKRVIVRFVAEKP